jgi:hypothetical protein
MRRRRDRSVPVTQFLTPIIIRDFGGESDPCFGKLYDLMAPECQSCGDQEMCGIAFSHKLKQKQLDYEKATPVKDLELTELELKRDVKGFIDKQVSTGLPKKVAVKLASRKFKVKASNINQIIKNNGRT